jgi:hypothetical protein
LPDQAARWLGELERGRLEFGGFAAERRLELLRALEKCHFKRSSQVLRLHKALCFIRAYPDDEQVLTIVERMLERFRDRSDLRRFRRVLRDSGIAGTTTNFAFFPATAGWLARRWGSHLTIQWREFERREKLEELLPRLALFGETMALDEFDLGARGWIERLKGPDETDAEFVLRRLEQLKTDGIDAETVLDELVIPFRLASGPDTPSRTTEKYRRAPVTFQTGPLRRSRPSIRKELALPPLPMRNLSPREGGRLIDLARATMVTRARDLDAFAHGNRNDVRSIDCGAGLQVALIGVNAKQRFLLETLYGFLLLKNGVPVGYGTYVALFNSAEIAFTIFDTFRTAEAAWMYGRVLKIAHDVLGCDVFTVDPYQIGRDNDDAIRSGAWWFYQKLGFRPRSTRCVQLMRQEKRRMKTDPAHRSSATTLRKLASDNLYLFSNRRREDVIGVLSLANVGLRITDYLAERFGYDRRAAEKTCATEAAKLLGARSTGRRHAGERLAWRRWGPLILALPGIERWPATDKQALVALVRMKGSPRESEYLLRFDRHTRLRQAIQRLAED